LASVATLASVVTFARKVGTGMSWTVWNSPLW
jgi:hypothetical protein